RHLEDGLAPGGPGALRKYRGGTAGGHAHRHVVVHRALQRNLRAPQEVFVGFTSLSLRIRHETSGHITEIRRGGLIAGLFCGLAVEIKPALGKIHWRQEGDIGITMLRGPFDGFSAADSRNPYWRMRLLERRCPRIDVAEVKMLPLPAKRARLGPGLDNQILGFLKGLPILRPSNIYGKMLETHSAHQALDH